jgi:hypothetical protein
MVDACLQSRPDEIAAETLWSTHVQTVVSPSPNGLQQLREIVIVLRLFGVSSHLHPHGSSS